MLGVEGPGWPLGYFNPDLHTYFPLVLLGTLNSLSSIAIAKEDEL